MKNKKVLTSKEFMEISFKYRFSFPKVVVSAKYITENWFIEIGRHILQGEYK